MDKVCTNCSESLAEDAVYCSKCGNLCPQLKVDALGSNSAKTKKGNLRIEGLVIAILFFSLPLALFILPNLQKSEPENSHTPTTSTAPDNQSLKFDGHCPGITYAMDETVAALQGAGTTYTASDVLDILKKNGQLFTGFASMSSEPNQKKVLQDTASELLSLRVQVLSNSDITKTGNELKGDFSTISLICR